MGIYKWKPVNLNTKIAHRMASYFLLGCAGFMNYSAGVSSFSTSSTAGSGCSVIGVFI